MIRITLNLSAAPSLRDRYALKWAIPVASIALVALFLLSRAFFQESRHYREIQSQLTAVQLRTADLHNREEAIRREFEDPANRDLVRHAKFVNDLIARRRFSLSEMSARIISLFPQNAHMTSLSVVAPKKLSEGFTVRIGIAAPNEDSVEAFMHKLEDAPDFKDVSINNQGFQEAIAQTDTINIVCTARSFPGLNVNTEKPSAEESTPNRQPHR